MLTSCKPHITAALGARLFPIATFPSLQQAPSRETAHQDELQTRYQGEERTHVPLQYSCFWESLLVR